jgi:inner membrane protein
VDAVTYFFNANLSLGFRRGWTHGVLAMAVLPALLAWVMHRVDKVRCRRIPAAQPIPVGRLLGMSYVAVLSHPALDWLNTYGVRLLMPFDGRWFYGDSLFIIDPWVWLLLGTCVVLAHSGSRSKSAGWIALAVISTILVTGIPGLPLGMRGIWCLGLAVIAGLRVWGGLQSQLQRVATVCLTLAAVYIAGMIGISQLARTQVVEWARDKGLDSVEIMVSPVPVDPFQRDIMITDDQHYHRLGFNWLAADGVVPRGPGTEIGDIGHPAASAALMAPEIWGFANWTRFPSFKVDVIADGYRVTITDIRFGANVVDLDQDLLPRPTR